MRGTFSIRDTEYKISLSYVALVKDKIREYFHTSSHLDLLLACVYAKGHYTLIAPLYQPALSTLTLTNFYP